MTSSPVTLRSNLISENTQTALKKTTSNLSTNYERLSSGLRINNAGDDAAGLALSKGLELDSKVNQQGIRNLNEGISQLNVATEALTELSSIASRQYELAKQASNGTLTRAQRIALNTEANALVDEFNRIVNSTSYNGRNLLDNGFGSTFVNGEAENGSISYDIGTALARTTGNGTFGTATSVSVVNLPQAGWAADLNNDGNMDFVTADFSGDVATVRLGNGNGTFQSAVSYNTGGGTSDPNGITAGDVNGDGYADLIVANRAGGTSSVGVLLNNGNGTFAAAASYAAAGSQSPFDVVLADFNGDGYQDIASANATAGVVGVYLNNGNGTFASQLSFTSGPTAYGLSAGDVNGDGRQDIVVANYGSANFGVLLGNGNGTFAAQVCYTTGTNPTSIRLADFNADGYLDAVTSDYNGGGNGAVVVRLGNGDGTFGSQITAFAAAGAFEVSVGDVNGDGIYDLFSANDNATNGNLSVAIGNGNGTFQAVATYDAYAAGADGDSRSAVPGDFNNDGATDLLVVLASPSTTGLLLGNTITRTTIGRLDITTTATATAALTTIDNTKTRVANEQGRLNGTLNRFESAVSNLKSKDEQTQYAISRIMDADLADETAQMVRNQILQKAETALLAQAQKLPKVLVGMLTKEE